MSAKTVSLAIGPDEKRILSMLIEEYLPGIRIWAYGSRVNGRARPSSDLDLVAFVDSEKSDKIYELREAFEQSDLGFRVDLFVWDEIPKSFQKNIKESHLVLQEGGDGNRD